MTIDLARVKARHSAYQWRMPCWIVLDRLARGLVVFCGPHAEYLESEPDRFFPWRSTTPKAQTESKIG